MLSLNHHWTSPQIGHSLNSPLRDDLLHSRIDFNLKDVWISYTPLTDMFVYQGSLGNPLAFQICFTYRSRLPEQHQALVDSETNQTLSRKIKPRFWRSFLMEIMFSLGPLKSRLVTSPQKNSPFGRTDVQGWYLENDVLRSGLIHVQTWNPFIYIYICTVRDSDSFQHLRGTLRVLWSPNQMRHAKKLGCWCLRAIIICPVEGTWNTEIWVPSCHEPTWMMSWFGGLYHFCSWNVQT